MLYIFIYLFIYLFIYSSCGVVSTISTRGGAASGKMGPSFVLVEPRVAEGLKLNNMRSITLRNITSSQHVRCSIVRRHCAPDDFQTQLAKPLLGVRRVVVDLRDDVGSNCAIADVLWAGRIPGSTIATIGV